MWQGTLKCRKPQFIETMTAQVEPDKIPAAGPAIILVEPQLGENIGMVARAMANFGLSELRLVNPRDGWPSEKARAAASRADHVIDAVAVFDDLASAIADLNFVVATTARQRDGFKSVRGPVEAGRVLRTRHAMVERRIPVCHQSGGRSQHHCHHQQPGRLPRG